MGYFCKKLLPKTFENAQSGHTAMKRHLAAHFCTFSGRKTHSQLLIQRADVSDSGNYTCAPSSSLPASIQVFVSGKLGCFIKLKEIDCFTKQPFFVYGNLGSFINLKLKYCSTKQPIFVSWELGCFIKLKEIDCFTKQPIFASGKLGCFI